jgi:LysR family hca operon transcriptional activator
LVAKEPIVVILPRDHPLAEHKAIDPHDLVGEKFIGISNVPRVLRGIVGDYLRRSGIEIVPHLEIDNVVKLIRQFMERNLRPDPVPDANWNLPAIHA